MQEEQRLRAPFTHIQTQNQIRIVYDNYARLQENEQRKGKSKGTTMNKRKRYVDGGEAKVPISLETKSQG